MGVGLRGHRSTERLRSLWKQTDFMWTHDSLTYWLTDILWWWSTCQRHAFHASSTSSLTTQPRSSPAEVPGRALALTPPPGGSAQEWRPYTFTARVCPQSNSIPAGPLFRNRFSGPTPDLLIRIGMLIKLPGDLMHRGLRTVLPVPFLCLQDGCWVTSRPDGGLQAPYPDAADTSRTHSRVWGTPHIMSPSFSRAQEGDQGVCQPWGRPCFCRGS